MINCGKIRACRAQKYKNTEHANCVAVCGNNKENAKTSTEKVGVPYTADYRNLIDSVGALSVAKNTKAHKEIASYFLRRGLRPPVENRLHNAYRYIIILRDKFARILDSVIKKHTSWAATIPLWIGEDAQRIVNYIKIFFINNH